MALFKHTKNGTVSSTVLPNPSRKVEAMYMYLNYELQLFTKSSTVGETIVTKSPYEKFSVNEKAWIAKRVYQTPLHTIDSVSYIQFHSRL